MELKDLLCKGYFSEKLPPPFTTRSYGEVLDQEKTALQTDFRSVKNISRCVPYNYYRNGLVSRKIGLPNPVSFFSLAEVVHENWMAIRSVAAQSSFSVSLPDYNPSHHRAVQPILAKGLKASDKAGFYANARHILKLDISRFYPSIYTHSIPWAMHGKSISKSNKNDNNLFGNRIDKRLQNCQDGQTKGIAIGTDTSFILAEAILGVVDKKLGPLLVGRCSRYFDDYTIACDTISQAEDFAYQIQKHLSEFELELNPTKTKILTLPQDIESPGIIELSNFIFSYSAGSRRKSIIEYFHKAFSLFRSGNEYILRYAIKRISFIDMAPAEMEIYQKLASQCVMSDFGCIKFLVESLVKYLADGQEVDLISLEKTLDQAAVMCLKRGCDNEAAWALWGHLLFGLSISKDLQKQAQESGGACIHLMMLHAKSEGLQGRPLG